MSEHSPGTQSQTIIDKFDFQFKAAVGGVLTDAAAAGAVTETDTMMAYVKQLVTGQLQIPTTAMRGTDAAFLAAVGGVLTDVASKTTDTATAIALLRYIVSVVDTAALASVLGALDTAAASGAVTDSDLVMAYIKQLVTRVEHLFEHAMHTDFLFPSATNLTCTLTAHADANTWSAWVAIVDSGATGLSASFAANNGHIDALQIEEANQASTHYQVELAWGAGKTAIGTARIQTFTANQPVNSSFDLNGSEITAGETVYARVMCATAAAKTLEVSFRNYLTS